MLCDSLCAFAHFIAGARAHGIALDWVASGLGGVRLRQQRAARESGHPHNVRTPCIACMICCDGALRDIDTPICKAPFRLALTVFLRTVGGVKSGLYSEMVAAFCYRRFTASLSFQWGFTQDNSKTTTRQLRDNHKTTHNTTHKTIHFCWRACAFAKTKTFLLFPRRFVKRVMPAFSLGSARGILEVY